MIKIPPLKHTIWISFCSLLITACNQASRSNQAGTDSLDYYPPTPGKMEPAEFRRYFRELSGYFDTTLLRGGFNGAVLVAKEGAILYEQYTGRTDINRGDSIGPSTAFHLASTSKPFTAMATLRLVQQGRLSLDDSLGRFFPGFPYPGINVRMLLSHRSGLPNYLYFMSNAKWGIGPDGKWNRRLASNEDMLQLLMQTRPAVTGRPGGRFNYSNTNYALLALIIERVSGKTFPDYMQESVFRPLGMKDTYVFRPADTATALHSYSAQGVFWDHDFLDATYGDKNIYSTPRDLLKWDQALYSGQWLEARWMDSAFQSYSPERTGIHHYGLGWRLQLLPQGKKVIYHFGKWHGFNAAFARLTDEKITVIILGNRFTRSVYNAAHRSYELFGDYGLPRNEGGDDSPESVTPPPGAASKTPVKKKS